ncbi:MAG: type II RES/Xre toxin-antitoxin system antitoxin [Limisphaerales bacterium]
MTDRSNLLMRMMAVDYGRNATRAGVDSEVPGGGAELAALRESPAAAISAGPSVDRLVSLVRHGLPARSFKVLCDAMGISAERLAKVAQIAPRTLARRRVFKPDESDRILRLGWLFQRAAEVLGTEAEARRWLLTPQWSLAGELPLDYADTEPGAREVEALLGRIEHGVAA